MLMRLRRGSEPAVFLGPLDRLGAVARPGLGDRGGQVVADRSLGQEQLPGNLRHGGTRPRGDQDIPLPRGADPAGFALTARRAAQAAPPGSARKLDGSGGQEPPPPQQPPRLVLVVDHFEELFTQCADEGQRRAFITALHAAATAGHGPDQSPAALVVLGVRADFEARCADYPQLAGPVQDRYLVTAMTERQLRMAITEPAKKTDSSVEDDLVEVLLAEVRTGQPGTFGAGMLPLLSHALDQAWRSRAGQAVTLADYDRVGGIEGAV